ncbi:hypothetical protein KY331_04345 [Candidatus Woesearchaeota archaeon]|nr:hypothetical protein [Candidatus Woesearchaeota archaeon]
MKDNKQIIIGTVVVMLVIFLLHFSFKEGGITGKVTNACEQQTTATSCTPYNSACPSNICKLKQSGYGCECQPLPPSPSGGNGGGTTNIAGIGVITREITANVEQETGQIRVT